MTGRWILVLASIMSVALTACGGTPQASDLPRLTGAGITIMVTESVETVPLPGCHSFWLSRGEEPPPGACEQTATVRRFTAQRDTQTVEASVVGEPAADPLYAMQLAAVERTGELSVMVVIAPADAAEVRLVDVAGEVVDRVAPAGGLVALAGEGVGLTVEALSPAGATIAACPPDGVIVGSITHVCTLAPGVTVPTTTTTLAGNRAA